MRDLEVAQLVGFCVLYAIYEPAIYHWIGDNRDNSHFCIPWYKAEGSILEAGDIIRSAMEPAKNEGPNMGLLNAAERYNRYAGMNLQALQKFGSVEARHMKTTTDTARIYQWINLLLALKRATGRVPASDVAIVRTVENMGAMSGIRNLLGPQFEFLNYPELERETFELGIPTANELIRNGLTVNLWEFMNAPKGVNPGFKKFVDSRKGRDARQFEEPEARVAAPPPVDLFLDEPEGEVFRPEEPQVAVEAPQPEPQQPQIQWGNDDPWRRALGIQPPEPPHQENPELAAARANMQAELDRIRARNNQRVAFRINRNNRR
jgi:hypothetical protein